MLGICALLSVVSALAKPLQLVRQLTDRPGEICQLACDQRCVLFGLSSPACQILRLSYEGNLGRRINALQGLAFGRAGALPNKGI